MNLTELPVKHLTESLFVALNPRTDKLAIGSLELLSMRGTIGIFYLAHSAEIKVSRRNL